MFLDKGSHTCFMWVVHNLIFGVAEAIHFSDVGVPPRLRGAKGLSSQELCCADGYVGV